MIYIANFARPKGAKDKQPRQRRSIKQKIGDLASAYITPNKVKERMEARNQEYKKLQKEKPSIRKWAGRGVLGGSVLGTAGAGALALALKKKFPGALTTAIAQTSKLSSAKGKTLSGKALRKLLTSKKAMYGAFLGAGATSGAISGGIAGTGVGVIDKLARGGKYKKAIDENNQAQAEDYLYRTKGGRRLTKNVTRQAKLIEKAARRYQA